MLLSMSLCRLCCFFFIVMSLDFNRFCSILSTACSACKRLPSKSANTPFSNSNFRPFKCNFGNNLSKPSSTKSWYAYNNMYYIWMGVPKHFTERWWGMKTFSIFKMGYEIFSIMRNYPPPWYPGLKMTTPLPKVQFES